MLLPLLLLARPTPTRGRVQRPRRPAGRAPAPARGRGEGGRRAGRAGLGAGGDAHRVLPVHPGGRRGRGRLDRGAGLVFGRPRSTSASARSRRTARCTRRSPTATSIASDDNVQILLGTFNDGRQASVFASIRSGCSRTGRWSRPGPTQRQRVQQRRGQAGDRRPEPRLRVRVQGAAHRLRLRGRGPDPVQEPPLPAGAGAALGHQHHPPGPALGRRGFLGAGQAGERLVPRASRATWSDSPISGAGWCSSSTRRSPRRPPARRGADGWDYYGRRPRARRQRALGRHQQPQLQRHRQPRLLAGRVRRRPVPVRSAQRAVLLREAAVLPRRHRAVHHAQPADLHPAHRAAGGGGRSSPARASAPTSRLLSAVDDPASRPAAQDHPDLQPAPAAARRRRAVAPRHGLHRPDRGQRLQPGGRASTRGCSSARCTACSSSSPAAAPGPPASRPRRRSGTPASSGTAAPSACGSQLDASDPDFRARSGFFPRPGCRTSTSSRGSRSTAAAAASSRA